jgi:cyclopropane-fatty-acyl-phospholipid synthase
MSGGELVLLEPSLSMRFGEALPGRSLRALVEVRSPRAYRELLRGSLGLCESYVEGLWECDDLVSLTRILARNVATLDGLRRALAPVLVPLQEVRALGARNTPRRARRRIAAHYDLGNDLFGLFLDPTMSYSCALFDVPGATLEEASLRKLERVCEKLELTEDDHLLEVGGGWGALAAHAAANHGCRVTMATISREQHAYARRLVREAGLEDRVTVLLCDYRELSGRYDKLVSIEMVEAVGWRNLPAFFRHCADLLSEEGAMLLQAITIDDEAYEVEKRGRSFINTHVFPGGCLPSSALIDRILERETDLRTLDVEDLTAHYVPTLAAWRERFDAASERLHALGYDERFQRLWRLYLSYCEGGFRERRIEDGQWLLAKPGSPLLACADGALDAHVGEIAA